MEMAANTGAVALNLWEEHVHSHVMAFNQLVLYIIPCAEVVRREGGGEDGEERRGGEREGERGRGREGEEGTQGSVQKNLSRMILVH